MTDSDKFEIFLISVPGLEKTLCDEARAAGFGDAAVTPGGVRFSGGWPEVWRANLVLRGATRVLVRLGSFRVFHLAQLDKRARKFPWLDTLRPDIPVRVETTCRKSKVYHAKAASQRICTALTESAGLTVADDAPLTVKVRIEDDLCTISIDSSGAPLHKRGYKTAVGKAPMRESMAAMFLKEAGFDGTETVLDPMCGSGTFVLEAAEIASGLLPGRTRRFAFEDFRSFDPEAWNEMRREGGHHDTSSRFFGSDRNAGAVDASQKNAEKAGVADLCKFEMRSISELERPDGPPGLVIVNPPYGGRIGNKKLLYALYGSFGKVMLERFRGWRVSVITTEQGLAKATGLPLLPLGPVVAHGGLKIRHFRTATL
ncbi:MAG: THUMP domain-containing class I SAM-dependent RNA methyltransferase [Paracoccaceae bacterium]